jgi:hypothetical protein
MQRLKTLSGKYQKRLIRPLYAHTQATPYGTSLDTQTLSSGTSFRNSDGSFRTPLSGDTTPLNTRTATVFTVRNSVVPGSVAVRTLGEAVAIASGINDGTVEQPFGLLANWLGGDFDDIGDENSVGVWRGPDAVFELLSPAYNSGGLSAAFSAAAVGKGNPVKLFAGPDGRLTISGAAGGFGGNANAANVAVCRVIDVPTSSRIIVDLLV